MTKITHALISVSDKTGIVELAKSLIQSNITILSTGGTAHLLQEHAIPVIDIASFTGFPEMMGGRVKTLHPRIYGGILARGDTDQQELLQHDIPVIGLVVVNLYPFQATIAKKDHDFQEAIEKIDIGGPCLLRASAKNYRHTTVAIQHEDFPLILSEIQSTGTTTLDTRLALAQKAFAHVSFYDSVISNYFDALDEKPRTVSFANETTLALSKITDLRYGENPHQRAAFYRTPGNQEATISNAIQHSGKPLSYNNIADGDCALECVKQLQDIACVIVKHANPCAVALGKTQLIAYQTAFNADSQSAFGGIIAFNSELKKETVETILSEQFVEMLIAPSVEKEALAIIEQKPNVRVLTTGNFTSAQQKALEYKSVHGGILIQELDHLSTPTQYDVVTSREPSPNELKDLLFAWKVVRYVKSNAIVFAKNLATLGIGPGQTSRVFSSKIALLKAIDSGQDTTGSVMASDAFFPFRDSIDEAAKVGIIGIIQPGGSIRDQEIIDAANEHGMTMLFTHRRHFKH